MRKSEKFYIIGILLYCLGLYVLAGINLRLFFSIGILTIGMLILIEAYIDNDKDNKVIRWKK